MGPQGAEHRPFEWGWRAVGLCSLCLVVGAAVPAAVCRWGLCPRCPGVGRCLSGVNISSSKAPGPPITFIHITFMALDLLVVSCAVVVIVVVVVSCVVLFLLCVCVCNLFLFFQEIHNTRPAHLLPTINLTYCVCVCVTCLSSYTHRWSMPCQGTHRSGLKVPCSY